MKTGDNQSKHEVTTEDIATAAALMGKHYHEDGTEHNGLLFLGIRDTDFPHTKEIVLWKNKEYETLIQLYMNQKLRIEPHDYLNRIGELKDLMKAHIKQTGSHYVEERKRGGEDD